MARFTLWKSDRSPSAGDFKPRVEAIVAEYGGVWLEGDERYDLRLYDGERVEAWIDEDDGSFEVDLERPHEGAFELIHAVADATGSFVTFETGRSARSLPSTGAQRTEDEGLVITPVPVSGRRELIDWMRSEMSDFSPSPSSAAPFASPPRLVERTFMQRLADVIFGKSN